MNRIEIFMRKWCKIKNKIKLRYDKLLFHTCDECIKIDNDLA